MITSPSQHARHYAIWITASVAVVFAAVYGGALVLLFGARDTIATQATELANEMRREESMHTLSDLLKDLSSETEKLNAFFVAPDGAVGAIERVEALSAVVGFPVTASDVHIENQDPVTGEGTLFLNVAVEGTWRSVMHALALLDTLPFQSTLESASLAVVDSDDKRAARWSLKSLLKIPLRR